MAKKSIDAKSAGQVSQSESQTVQYEKSKYKLIKSFPRLLYGKSNPWINYSIEQPRYYDNVHIMVFDPNTQIGFSVRHDYHRLSNGVDEFFGNNHDGQIIPADEVLIWRPPTGVKYPKDDPMTEKDLNPIDQRLITPGEIKKLITKLKLERITKDRMPFDDGEALGYNTGLNEGILALEKFLKRKLKENTE